MTLFRDRRQGGERLAQALIQLKDKKDVVVIALPRGGVPVGYEVARALHAPLDILVVRKLALPEAPEVAIGAIAGNGIRVLNSELVRQLNMSEAEIHEIERRELKELKRRERSYRGEAIFPDLREKTVILVDDGLATGATMRAALKAIRTKQPAEVIVAVPVASAEACAEFGGPSEHVCCICSDTPEPFLAVGQSYENFLPTSDVEVRTLLDSYREQRLMASA